MKLDGIWTAEVAGPNGWDNAGLLVLDKGRVTGGSNVYYTRGTYALTREGIEMALKIRFYGITRTLLGECREEMSVELLGKRDKNIMYGRMTRKDKPRYSVAVRAIKQSDLTSDYPGPTDGVFPLEVPSDAATTPEANDLRGERQPLHPGPK